MNHKTIFHQFDPVIYPYKIWISDTINIKEVSNRFKYRNNKEIEIEEPENCNAATYDVRQKEHGYYGALIIFKSHKHMTIERIAHESSHAAKQLFEHIGADMRHHEPFEYLVGFIAKSCEEVKNYNKKARR